MHNREVNSALGNCRNIESEHFENIVSSPPQRKCGVKQQCCPHTSNQREFCPCAHTCSPSCHHGSRQRSSRSHQQCGDQRYNQCQTDHCGSSGSSNFRTTMRDQSPRNKSYWEKFSASSSPEGSWETFQSSAMPGQYVRRFHPGSGSSSYRRDPLDDRDSLRTMLHRQQQEQMYNEDTAVRDFLHQNKINRSQGRSMLGRRRN